MSRKRWSSVGIGFKALDGPCHEVSDHDALETEWQVACESEDGHFKYLMAMNQWDAVFPFCQAVDIPHLPEKPAYQCRAGAGDRSPPVACRHFRKQVGLPR